MQNYHDMNAKSMKHECKIVTQQSPVFPLFLINKQIYIFHFAWPQESELFQFEIVFLKNTNQ